MTKKKRLLRRPHVLLFLALLLLVTGCSGVTENTNWPGMSAEGDRVYVAYGNEVVAVDIAAQRGIWSFPADPGAIQFFATPNVVDGQVALGDYGARQGFLTPGVISNVYLLEDVDSGDPRRIWTTEENNEAIARDRIVAAALQVDDQVFVGTADNNVIALDASTGAENWRVALGHSVWAQPTYADGVVVVTSLDRGVYALDATNGSQKWHNVLEGAVAAKPVVADGVVYVGGFDGQLHAFDLQSGSEQWQFEATDWIWSAPAIENNNIYFADAKGVVFALDKDGNEQWRQELEGEVEGSVLVADGSVFVPVVIPDGVNRVGKLVALSAENGTQQWIKETLGALYTTPVIANDQIVIAYTTDDEPLVLDILQPDGTQVWTFSPVEG